MGFLDIAIPGLRETEALLDPEGTIEKVGQSITDPGGFIEGEFKEDVALISDPLSAFQGLPGLDGLEGVGDRNKVSRIRAGEEKKEKARKAALLNDINGQRTTRRSTIKTGSRGLAEGDSANIATGALLG
jgi:hypothetical protein